MSADFGSSITTAFFKMELRCYGRPSLPQRRLQRNHPFPMSLLYSFDQILLIFKSDGRLQFNWRIVRTSSQLRSSTMVKMWLVSMILGTWSTICEAQQWVPLVTGTTDHLRDVHFVTALEGYIVGENATILKTTDGGQTWTTVPNPTPSGVALLGLHVQQGDQGSIVHVCGNQPDAFGNNPTLLRSLDGGSTWEQQMLSLATGQGFLIDVHCQSEQDCFLAGTETEEGAMVAHNTSGGSVWPHQILYMDVLGTPTSAANLREFSFPSSEVGYCVGVDDQNLNGIVFKTLDAGTSWTAVHEFTGPSYLMSIRCLSIDECFCSSINGSIYRTVDGGNTWTELQVHDNIVADPALSISQ